MSYNNSLEGSALLSVLGVRGGNIEFNPPLVYPHFMQDNKFELEIECSGNNGEVLQTIIEKWLVENGGEYVKLNDITLLITKGYESLLVVFTGMM